MLRNGKSSADANEAAASSADGRRLRSEVSRERIVGAMLALIGAGAVTPGAEAVAAKAGVGLRTVFRHFENMETLYQRIDTHITGEVRPLAEAPFKAREWKGKVLEMLARRARIFERIMPFKTAADVHRHQSPFLSAQTGWFVREQRVALLAILPPERQADVELVESLDLLLSFDCWRRLRKDQKLSVARAQQTLDQLIRTALKAKR
jgi:AcrR family transcriptional regulator